MTDLVAAVRAHANRNYEKGGWDILVECWEDAEIIECIGGATSEQGAIAKCARTLRNIDDYRRDIQGA